ncbi:MAG: hypothetical protein U0X91_20795 [Spirosomataceae bacterium]
MLVTISNLGNPKQSNIGWVRRLYVLCAEAVKVYDPIRYPERTFTAANTLTTGDIMPVDMPVLYGIQFPKRGCTMEQKQVETEGGIVYDVTIQAELTTHAPDFFLFLRKNQEKELVALAEDQNGTCYLIGNEEHGLRAEAGGKIADINSSAFQLTGRFAYPVFYLSTLEPAVLFAELGFEPSHYTTTEYETI